MDAGGQPAVVAQQALHFEDAEELGQNSEAFAANKAYHEAMKQKYLRAAASPWLPVMPDPSEPLWGRSRPSPSR